jgi:hypothetical protein
MALEAWAASQPQTLEKWPDLPNAIQDRDADVWEALIAVCNVAGGSWPSRIRYAVVTLVTAAKEAEPIVSLSMRDHARFRSRKTGKPFDFIHWTGFARDPVRWHLARERRRWRGRGISSFDSSAVKLEPIPKKLFRIATCLRGA